MGVDYSPVGGVGIKVTDKIKNKLRVANNGDGDDITEILDSLELPYAQAGDGNYSGNDNDFYLKVEGETLVEINSNAPAFIEKLKGYNVDISLNDLIMIEDLHVW